MVMMICFSLLQAKCIQKRCFKCRKVEAVLLSIVVDLTFCFTGGRTSENANFLSSRKSEVVVLVMNNLLVLVTARNAFPIKYQLRMIMMLYLYPFAARINHAEMQSYQAGCFHIQVHA